jgi:hypothetical protein
MIKVKIFYLVMPWQIDYALLSYTQFKKSHYYIKDDIEVTIDTHLNLSNHITDWDNSQIPKEFFIKKYNDLAVLLNDYKHNSIIYDGDENYGLLDMQKIAYGEEYDYYIPVCPDMYFSEHLLTCLIEAARLVKNKYFVITPEIHKMWDWTWDEITNQQYMDIPYSEWNSTDIFDIRHNLKINYNTERLLVPTQRSKWAIWFDIYSKSFYEDLCPVHDDWIGYGPWDWYSMMLSEHIKSLGVDFQQYVLKGETIFEYSVGPLKDRDFTNYYKDFLKIKVGAKEQRDKFEARMGEYLQKGLQMAKDKNILPENIHTNLNKVN